LKPTFQGQEPAEIGEVDNQADLITNKLRIMMRAAPSDIRRHRGELREMLQGYVDKCMAFADAIER
jgi:hypothetical protein